MRGGWDAAPGSRGGAAGGGGTRAAVVGRGRWSSPVLPASPLRTQPSQHGLGLTVSLWTLFTSLLTQSISLSIYLLTHGLVLLCVDDTVSSYGICQGMSWQHLNQPQVWIGVISLSLSLSLSPVLLARFLAYVQIHGSGLILRSFHDAYAVLLLSRAFGHYLNERLLYLS